MYTYTLHTHRCVCIRRYFVKGIEHRSLLGSRVAQPHFIHFEGWRCLTVKWRPMMGPLPFKFSIS